jgi:hypothetical protein
MTIFPLKDTEFLRFSFDENTITDDKDTVVDISGNNFYENYIKILTYTDINNIINNISSSTLAILPDGLYFKKNGATYRLYTNGLFEGPNGGIS